MARRPRIHVPGGLYHVIARGNRRLAIFRGPQDYGGYLRRLEEGLRRTGTRCFGFVLMPNHVHLLLETGQAPLARLMQGLQQGYTQEFNRRHRLVGHVFQGRYKTILCDRDAYLLELVRYLHLNPVRTKLVLDPADYRWSSHRAYLGRERIPWLSAESVLGMFHSERRVAGRAYTRFIAEGLPQGHRDDLYEVWEQRYLGDERFVERLERQVREALPKLRAITITDILRVVAEEFGCTVKEIISYSQRRVAAQARHWVALLASEVAGERITAAAAALRRSPGSLSVGISRLRHTLLENPAEGKRLQRLSAILHQRSHPKYKKGRS